MLAPTAADAVLHHPTDEDLTVGTLAQLGDGVHRSFLFFPSLESLCFVLVLAQAATGCLAAASAMTPMAQMKPSSSRPTAVMIFF